MANEKSPVSVTSVYPVLPVNAHSFAYSAWAAITSAAGIATSSLNFIIPQGYVAVLRKISHVISPAIMGYPSNPATPGKGIIINITNNVSGMPDISPMNLMQAESNVPVYGLFRPLSNMGYSLSINEDVAGQFGSSFLWVQMIGDLLSEKSLPLALQVGS